MFESKFKSLLLVLSLCGPVAAVAAETVAALDRTAMMSARAPKVALLAAARADGRLFAAGERGVIVYSDDGGKNWQQAKTPTNASLTAVQFIDGKRGWAVGHMGIVLHTEDGGLTWSKQLDGIAAAQRALEAAKAGGDERALRDAERLVADGPDKPFFDVRFLDERTGFIVGAYNLIFRTEDGGKTWTSWQSHLAAVNPRALHLYALRAQGDALFIAGEQGLLLRSDDRGEHFTALKSSYAGTWFGLLASRDGGLLAYGLRGNAYYSADRGRTWKQATTNSSITLSAAVQLHDGRIALINQAGNVLVSGDDGHSFTLQPGRPGLPLTAAVEAGDGLLVASLRGVATIPLAAK
jgi:photosystem II stability/assembly factor-like uncharacterized protein